MGNIFLQGSQGGALLCLPEYMFMLICTLRLPPWCQSEQVLPQSSVSTFQSKYEMQGQVGKGTFGTAHIAKSKQGLVVVKVSFDFQTAQEAQLLHYCQHPNVVKLIDTAMCLPFVAFAMEHWQCNLRQYAATCGQRLAPEQDAKRIFQDVATALSHIHSKHIVHLDLHTGNILLNAKGGSPLQACLADFGLANSLDFHVRDFDFHMLHNRWSRAPELYFGKGSSMDFSRRRHCPPQQKNLLVSTAVDIWALGVMVCDIVELGWEAPWPMQERTAAALAEASGDQDFSVAVALLRRIGAHPKDSIYKVSIVGKLPEYLGGAGVQLPPATTQFQRCVGQMLSMHPNMRHSALHDMMSLIWARGKNIVHLADGN